MKDFLYVLAATVAAFLGLYALLSLVTFEVGTNNESGSTVKILSETGHGSATHIGNGYLITADHVVDKGEEFKVKSDDGKERTAIKLWGNHHYDVALLQTDGSGISDSRIECRTPVKGEVMTLRGNPRSLEFGQFVRPVAGVPFELKGHWENVIPVDGDIAGGMSGGGAFDDDGDLVGINVGGLVERRGPLMLPFGVGAVVPASTICHLLGRVE